jgi:hypothetical protein
MLDDELATLMATLTYGSPAVSVTTYYGVGPEEPLRTAYPFLVVSRVSAPSDQSCDGDIVFTAARYSFDVGATARRTARIIADALIALLQGHQGTLIKGIEHETDYDMYDVDTRTHHIVSDFMVEF